jgi:hypothetical protein
MTPRPILALTLFAGASAVWLAATIDPSMLTGSACGAAHCWRCTALAADLIILIAAALHRTRPKTA